MTRSVIAGLMVGPRHTPSLRVSASFLLGRGSGRGVGVGGGGGGGRGAQVPPHTPPIVARAREDSTNRCTNDHITIENDCCSYALFFLLKSSFK